MEITPAVDAYGVVLADLRAQRDQIDQTIALLEGLRGRPAGGALPVEGSFITGASVAPATLGPGAFLGLTIVDATKKLLAHERRQMTNAEVVEALTKGGLALNSADPLNTVGSVLNRRFMQSGDVVRVGRGVWGLKEWYPNRTFNRKPISGLVVAGGSRIPYEIGDSAPESEGNPDEDLMG